MMKVTYLEHSGFYIQTENNDYLFDYYKGGLPAPENEKSLFVFVSHAHYDHYRKEIFSLRKNSGKVTFILSSDIPVPEEFAGEDIVFIGPNEECKIGECEVRTLRSTDEGVAFLVSCCGKTFYHAGDMNWWHWQEESKEYNTAMRRAYQSEINKLQGMKIDVAFVPVDPRLGEQYCLGLDCFMKRTDTRYVFPMHFWGNYDIFARLMLEKCTEEYRSRIIRIESARQEFILDTSSDNNTRRRIGDVC